MVIRACLQCHENNQRERDSNRNLKIQNSMSELAKAKAEWILKGKQQQNFESQKGFIMSWVAFSFDGIDAPFNC